MILKTHFGELLRFGIVGIAATITHMLVAFLTLGFFSSYIANFLGFCVAVSVSYLGHKYYTFYQNNRRLAHTKSLFRFIVVAISSIMLSQLILFIGTSANFYPRIALLIAIIIIPGYTYLLNKFWAFAQFSDSN